MLLVLKMYCSTAIAGHSIDIVREMEFAWMKDIIVPTNIIGRA
jgi:hypothetical protein